MATENGKTGKTSKTVRPDRARTTRVQPEKQARGVTAWEIILLVILLAIVAFALVRFGAKAPQTTEAPATEAPASPESQSPQEICGEAGVWYTVPVEGGTKVYCNTGPGTEDPAATEAPAEVTEDPAATEDPTESPAQPEPADRIARLIELDKVYRAQGWMAWLKSAGVTCDAAVEARQPEEETVTDANGAHVVVSGIQVKGNCTIPWPAVVTTDRPNEVETSADSRTYQPDLKNPSVMYTNAKLKGQGTIWVDNSNWGQLDPTK